MKKATKRITPTTDADLSDEAAIFLSTCEIEVELVNPDLRKVTISWVHEVYARAYVLPKGVEEWIAQQAELHAISLRPAEPGDFEKQLEALCLEVAQNGEVTHGD